MQMTKAQLRKMLVDERAKQREKSKHSLFMSRTRGIYSGQQNRYEELTGKNKKAIPYTLEDLREHCAAALESGCPYCDKKLTVKTMCGDHAVPLARGGAFTLKNLVICHAQCNWRKGAMTDSEFRLFSEMINVHLPKEVADDIWRRLSTGGKFLKQGR